MLFEEEFCDPQAFQRTGLLMDLDLWRLFLAVISGIVFCGRCVSSNFGLPAFQRTGLFRIVFGCSVWYEIGRMMGLGCQWDRTIDVLAFLSPLFAGFNPKSPNLHPASFDSICNDPVNFRNVSGEAERLPVLLGSGRLDQNLAVEDNDLVVWLRIEGKLGLRRFHDLTDLKTTLIQFVKWDCTILQGGKVISIVEVDPGKVIEVFKRNR
jgi:hypothetical protein